MVQNGVTIGSQWPEQPDIAMSRLMSVDFQKCSFGDKKLYPAKRKLQEPLAHPLADGGFKHHYQNGLGYIKFLFIAWCEFTER